MTCGWCGTTFTPTGRQQWCSDACKQAAWRARHAAPKVPPRARRHDTVYQCPQCDTRYLGERRCPDCNLFCRSLGPGGPCPHCDGPVAVTDLLTPQ
jgi:hypothetical protein